MASATIPKTYKNIKVIDPNEAVWVSPIDTNALSEEDIAERRYGTLFILMGPTGSGKSSFIEAIASMSTREPLAIAKDQLESVTQQSCLYEVRNIKRADFGKIYIMDTPGFADPTISELQVLDQITNWRNMSQSEERAVRLLFFHPITDIRMPASRRQCLEMVRHFWGFRLSKRAVLVTSFWDRLPERSRNAAEKRFTQLSTSHWGDWIERGSSAVKFENTFHSAMQILNELCRETDTQDYPKVSGLGIDGTTGNPVYEALFSRLASLEQKRDMIQEDLTRPKSQGQTELISILTRDLKQTEMLLQKFSTEMEDFLRRFSPPQASQSYAIAAVTDAPPDATGITDETIDRDQQKALSLSKRLSLWVHKKVDKINLGQLGRKGA